MKAPRFVAFVVALCAAAGLLAGCREQATPRVLLISLDGWRWDYRDRFETPVLDALAAEGASGARLQPAFPSKTFPNHFTLVTGLVPDHHGIVSNTIRDPDTGAWFRMADRAAVVDPTWWQAEPIWTTLEKQGRKTAPLLWPGSEAPIGGVVPARFVVYEQDLTDAQRIDMLAASYAKPEAEWPVFATLYWHDVDTVGHRYGPGSKEVQAAAERVDRALGQLRARLESLGASSLNVILVSDHGMSELSEKRVIYLEDYIDLAAVETVDSSPNLGLVPKTLTVDEIYARLADKHPHLNVYRKADIPARLQYGTHPRVPPVFIMADDGWTILPRRTSNSTWSRFGTHGYDNSLDSMQGLFVAAGPAFRRGVRLEQVRSIDVYEVMCRILDVTPRKHDGDARLARAILR
ncbi:MAG: alkaline phosphatase family protein [Acidobacteriota bacterium]|nr:alkaline phosphatase family protein [Acidobacteriota bacterium]